MFNRLCGLVPAYPRLFSLQEAELPAANAYPQREFCGSERAPQRSRPLSALLILAPQRLAPSVREACPSPQPSPRKRGEGGFQDPRS
jgi:hypothetical protein